MHIMWNDSHSDVRKAAAQSLGKCGYGRLVHDKMIQILMEGTQTERSETLSKIGYLGKLMFIESLINQSVMNRLYKTHC